jgi:PAS domain S-box-containing protein
MPVIDSAAAAITAGTTDLFHALLEAAPDAIVIVDRIGQIHLVNAQAEVMFGYPRQELAGRNVDTLVPQRFRGDHSLYRDEYAVNGRVRPMGHGLDLFGLRRDGREFPVEISLSPLNTAEGLLITAVIRDVTERRLVEQRAQTLAAELYEQQRHVALTLQNALMGAVAPVPGLCSAGRYLPATQGAGVGGDWYDLIPLGAGRTGVLVGDVMGRGLEAATVMGRLRSAANALARTGMAPQQLMSALEEVARDTADQLTTCCYLIIDPRAGEVSGCSAGHLPAVLACPDGSVRRLPVPLSAPLGVGTVPHRQATVPVPAGATLALYTDGLIERRDRDIDAQVTVLQDQLAGVVAAGLDLEEAADQLLAAFSPAASDPLDDVTLLLIQMPDEPLSATACTLDPEPRSAGTARAWVRETLTQWEAADLIDTACLLVTEVLTNAIQHAHSPVGLQLYLTGSEVIVEVNDDSARLPQRCLPDDEDENGRGLLLVGALAASWGVRPAETGKTVWFTLATGPGSGRDSAG